MRTLPVLLALLSAGFLSAQSFSLSDTLLEANANVDIYNIYHIYIANETDTAVALSWRRLEQDHPEGWEATFCDNNVCYDHIPINGDMIPFGPEETAFLKLDVDPSGVPGVGTFRFLVFPSADPADRQLATFLVQAGGTSSTTSLSAHYLRIAPNPVQDELRLTNPGAQPLRVVIHDAHGRPLHQASLASGMQTQINTQHWPSGWYALQASSDGQLLFRDIIVKH